MSAFERLRLLIAYDGRPFAGWQSQAGKNGIQDHIERALQIVSGVFIRVHGSGRTDAGVHALGQVAHADVPRGLRQPATWLAALNANLPAEIRILRATRARASFHARFSATGKRYLYRIWNSPVLPPLQLRRAWHVPRPLNVAAMRLAAALLTGRHDFAAFAANRGKPESDTIRTLRALSLAARGPLLTLRFEGDGFLYKMVRLLTGTLVRIGEGKADEAHIRALLAAGGARKSHFVAPAEGLYLDRVHY